MVTGWTRRGSECGIAVGCLGIVIMLSRVAHPIKWFFKKVGTQLSGLVRQILDRILYCIRVLYTVLRLYCRCERRADSDKSGYCNRRYFYGRLALRTALPVRTIHYCSVSCRPEVLPFGTTPGDTKRHLPECAYKRGKGCLNPVVQWTERENSEHAPEVYLCE